MYSVPQHNASLYQLPITLLLVTTSRWPWHSPRGPSEGIGSPCRQRRPQQPQLLSAFVLLLLQTRQQKIERLHPVCMLVTIFASAGSVHRLYLPARSLESGGQIQPGE